MISKPFSIIACMALALVGLQNASADVILTFDFDTSFAGSRIPATYGNRVTSFYENGFSYGGDGSFTPNVSVDASNLGNNLLWPSNYGDLQNVLFTYSRSSSLAVFFYADSAYWVELVSFDLAGWPNTDYPTNFIEINGLRVIGDDVTRTQYRRNNVYIEGDFVGNRRTTIEPEGIYGNWFILNINTAPYYENIGIDNIRFRQFVAPVPAPPGFVIAGIGIFLFIVMKRFNLFSRQTPALNVAA
jgi:hypothetical protein